MQPITKDGVPGAGASIVYAIYNGEHYKRYEDADTKDKRADRTERDAWRLGSGPNRATNNQVFEMHEFPARVDKGHVPRQRIRKRLLLHRDRAPV